MTFFDILYRFCTNFEKVGSKIGIRRKFWAFWCYMYIYKVSVSSVESSRADLISNFPMCRVLLDRHFFKNSKNSCRLSIRHSTQKMCRVECRATEMPKSCPPLHLTSAWFLIKLLETYCVNRLEIGLRKDGPRAATPSVRWVIFHQLYQKGGSSSTYSIRKVGHLPPTPSERLVSFHICT